jgi:uncharacterized protein
MNRIEEVFGTRRVLLPVIHPINADEAMRSVQVAWDAGVRGIFLIDQGMSRGEVLDLILDVRKRHPKLWVGLNLLGKPPAEILRLGLGACAGRLDGIWTDNAGIDEDAAEQPQAQAFVDARARAGWNGLYFGGVAFKYQREVPAEKLSRAASTAKAFMDVLCTSGPGTGQAADPAKVIGLRNGLGPDGALALASGVTDDNVAGFLPHVDAYLVGTGIEKDFGVLDPGKVARLQALISGGKPLRDPVVAPAAPARPRAPVNPFKTIPDRVYEYGYKNGRQIAHHLVDVTASGRDLLTHAMAIAFRGRGGARVVRATHVAEAGKALVFLDRAPGPHALRDRTWTVRALATPVDLDGAVELAWQWLERADYGRDEHDGGVDKGWHVFNGQFGIVDEVWETFLAVEPTYLYIPK